MGGAASVDVDPDLSEREKYFGRLQEFYKVKNPERCEKAILNATLDVWTRKEKKLFELLEIKYKTGIFGGRKTLPPDQDPEFGIHPDVRESLADLYQNYLFPLEEKYQVAHFGTPKLLRPFFTRAPLVMLVGQYSVGKTSFLHWLLGGSYPGERIGPEPTTDTFTLIEYGDREVVPGNALVAQGENAYSPLKRFGAGFLNRLQCARMDAPALREFSCVDTPGVLSGKKQGIESRKYDFQGVSDWFAERASRILVLFDVRKLDISDEFSNMVRMLGKYASKVRVLLNKCDSISTRELLHVYGALMFQLGHVIKTPEVPKLFLSSFWDNPIQATGKEMLKLMSEEKVKLLHDMGQISRSHQLACVEDFAKRASDVKVHSLLVGHIRSKMQGVFGAAKKRRALLANFETDVFEHVRSENELASGDLPDRQHFLLQLGKLEDWKKELGKPDPELLQASELAIGVVLQRILRQLSAASAVAARKKDEGFMTAAIKREKDNADAQLEMITADAISAATAAIAAAATAEEKCNSTAASKSGDGSSEPSKHTTDSAVDRSELHQALVDLGFDSYEETLRSQWGLVSVDELVDLTDEDLDELGMKRLEKRRLRKKFPVVSQEKLVDAAISSPAKNSILAKPPLMAEFPDGPPT